MPKVNRLENEPFTSSTPMVSSGSKTFPDADLPSVSPHKLGKQPIIDLIIEAVETVGVKRKGASYQAIKKYVQNARESEAPRLTNQLKLALKKGIEQGVLARPSASKDANGATGSYLVLKKQPVKGKKLAEKAEVIVKKPKKGISAVSDSEVTGKPKPMKIPKKLNLSDRTLSELEQITEPEEKLHSKHKQKENLDLKQKPKPKIQTKESNKAKSEVTDLKKQKVTKDTVKPEKKRIPKIKNRKDLSDSEMVVRKPNRKSMKSYSSDTEVNNITAKPKKNAPKEIGAKVAKKPKNKAVEVPPPAIHTPAKVITGRKLYDKSAEQVMQTDVKDVVKKARTRNKKETS